MSSSAHPEGSVPNAQETPSVVYDLQTSFDNIDKRIMVAGSTSVYMAEMVFTHPFEVIRTQIQTSQTVSSIEILKRNLSQGGLKSLYAGFFPALFGHMPGNAVYLVTYTFLKDRFQKYDDKKHPGRISDGTQAPWVSAAAAAGADLAAISLYVPVDVVAQRLYLQTPTGAPRYSGYQEVIKTILTNEGWKGFYKGVGPILVNSLPASALWWTLYEESKRFLSKKFSDYRSVEAANKLAANKVSQADGSSSATSESSPFEPTTKVVEKSSLASFISGGIAGAAVTFFTNPLDVVSTRLQTQSMKAEAYQYTGTLHTIKEMWRTEGFRSFFKGTTPRLTQWVIFSAIGGFSYEFIVDLSTIKK